jgi:hypothetical protein
MSRCPHVRETGHAIQLYFGYDVRDENWLERLPYERVAEIEALRKTQSWLENWPQSSSVIQSVAALNNLRFRAAITAAHTRSHKYRRIMGTDCQ